MRVARVKPVGNAAARGVKHDRIVDRALPHCPVARRRSRARTRTPACVLRSRRGRRRGRSATTHAALLDRRRRACRRAQPRAGARRAAVRPLDPQARWRGGFRHDTVPGTVAIAWPKPGPSSRHRMRNLASCAPTPRVRVAQALYFPDHDRERSGVDAIEASGGGCGGTSCTAAMSRCAYPSCERRDDLAYSVCQASGGSVWAVQNSSAMLSGSNAVRRRLWFSM